MRSSTPWALTWYILPKYDILYTCRAQSYREKKLGLVETILSAHGLIVILDFLN